MNAVPPPTAVVADRLIPRPRRQWRTALGALRRLLRDKDDTAQVFEIMRALNGPSTRDGYLRLLASTRGGRIAYHRRELAEVLMDRARLATYPADSVAAAYLAFTARGQISADGLAAVSRAVNRDGIDLAHPIAWYGRRIRDIHDLWHVLAGYDLTALGEAALVAFSYAQTRGLGWAAIAIGAAAKGATRRDQPYVAAIREGYRRGKTAAWLPGEDYEALLAEPLAAARARLGLAPPAVFDRIPVPLRDRVLPTG